MERIEFMEKIAKVMVDHCKNKLGNLNEDDKSEQLLKDLEDEEFFINKYIKNEE